MPEDINLSVNVNGQSQVPPGFRFHPTEEELLHYYLRKKVAYEKIDLNVIRDVDLNKLEPWDIQEKCKIGSTPQNDWYFFSHKDKKYPTGTRTNRATTAGFWKATGRDKVIHSSFRRIGMRKTLVFYKGRAPHGQKSDWIMHEYRLDDNTTHDANASNLIGDQSSQEEGWVVCRVFKKKNYHKALESPQRSTSVSMDSRAQIQSATKDGVLDQILLYMGRSCKQENETITNFINNQNNISQFVNNPINTAMIKDDLEARFFHLPRLESPTTLSHTDNFHDQDSSSFKPNCGQSMSEMLAEGDHQLLDGSKDRLDNWADLDRLVASQLNGGHAMDSSSKHLNYSCYGEPNEEFCFSIDHDEESPAHLQRSTTTNQRNYGSEIDLWSFARSSSSSSPPDPLCHLSV